MDRLLVCIGGGEIKDKTTKNIDAFIAALAKKHAGDKRARGLFIGTASHDFMPYFNSFRKTYTSDFDVKADCLLTVYTTYDREKIKEKFDLCDFIYVGGGDTVFMLEKWAEAGITPLIIDAYERGVPICGLSAGAICWFETMYTDSESVSVDDKYSFYKGLKILDGVCSPHFDHRRVDLFKAIAENDIKSCYAIDDNAALVFKNERPVGSLSSGGKAYTIRNNQGVCETYEIENINGETGDL